jgi:hypothetical protein
MASTPAMVCNSVVRLRRRTRTGWRRFSFYAAIKGTPLETRDELKATALPSFLRSSATPLHQPIATFSQTFPVRQQLPQDTMGKRVFPWRKPKESDNEVGGPPRRSRRSHVNARLASSPWPRRIRQSPRGSSSSARKSWARKPRMKPTTFLAT